MKYLIMGMLVLIPSTLWAGNFHHQKQQVFVKEKVVEFDADYFIGYNGYYSVPQKINEERESTEYLLLEQNRLLIEVINKLLDGKSDGPNVDVDVDVSPEPKPAPNPQPQPEPNDPDLSSNLDNKVFQIFKANCASCHGNDKQSGGFALVGEDEQGEFMYDISLARRVNISDVTSGVGLQERGKKLMPLGGQPLSDEDVELIQLWTIERAEDILAGRKED